MTWFERSLYPHNSGKESFYLLSSICPGYPKMQSDVKRYLIAPILYKEGLSNIFLILLTAYATRKYGHSLFRYFVKPWKVDQPNALPYIILQVYRFQGRQYFFKFQNGGLKQDFRNISPLRNVQWPYEYVVKNCFSNATHLLGFLKNTTNTCQGDLWTAWLS